MDFNSKYFFRKLQDENLFEDKIIIGVRNNHKRQKLADTIEHSLVSLLHSSAQISKSAIIKGTLFFAGAVI